MRKIVDTILPTTMVGSYPRPHWFTYQLDGRDVRVAFKNVGVYAAGTRHALDLSVRAVSETHTSISVKRDLFEEQRIFWSRERTQLPSDDTAVEQAVLDAIEHLL